MTVEKTTNYGNISVSEDAIASLAGGVITECYGVVGMASKKNHIKHTALEQAKSLTAERFQQ